MPQTVESTTRMLKSLSISRTNRRRAAEKKNVYGKRKTSSIKPVERHTVHIHVKRSNHIETISYKEWDDGIFERRIVNGPCPNFFNEGVCDHAYDCEYQHYLE